MYPIKAELWTPCAPLKPEPGTVRPPSCEATSQRLRRLGPSILPLSPLHWEATVLPSPFYQFHALISHHLPPAVMTVTPHFCFLRLGFRPCLCRTPSQVTYPSSGTTGRSLVGHFLPPHVSQPSRTLSKENPPWAEPQRPLSLALLTYDPISHLLNCPLPEGQFPGLETQVTYSCLLTHAKVHSVQVMLLPRLRHDHSWVWGLFYVSFHMCLCVCFSPNVPGTPSTLS